MGKTILRLVGRVTAVSVGCVAVPLAYTLSWEIGAVATLLAVMAFTAVFGREIGTLFSAFAPEESLEETMEKFRIRLHLRGKCTPAECKFCIAAHRHPDAPKHIELAA